MSGFLKNWFGGDHIDVEDLDIESSGAPKNHAQTPEVARVEEIEQSEKEAAPQELDQQPTLDEDLLDGAAAVLAGNDRDTYTMPAPALYPHQWLWDSCFVAIGLRHLDVNRAQTELMSLVRGQWANGMIPNMIFSPEPAYQTDRNYWRSWINTLSPDDVATSGITQPPVLAEAVWRIGEKLNRSERKTWYKLMLPHIISYHKWLYNDRDPHKEGLILLVHPWETGLDNTPPWMHALQEHQEPLWIRILFALRAERVIELFRRDRKNIPSSQRLTNLESVTLFDAQRRLRRKNYNTLKILSHGLFTIEDLTFNCIFIRANQLLIEMSEFIHYEIDESLLTRIKKTERSLEQLWDPYGNTYWSRNFVTHQHLKHPSLASLMPLYAGSISKTRARELVKQLENPQAFGLNYAVPSVPKNSPDFDPDRYWQGPTWVNTNWLIIDGLRRYGYGAHAEALADSTIEMVAKSGFYEYFNPETGDPLGAADFSWTAALIIDLLKSGNKNAD